MKTCARGISSAKRLPGVPGDAARNKGHVMVLIAGEDKYTQRENLKSRLGFFRFSNEKLALAEYIHDEWCDTQNHIK